MQRDERDPQVELVRRYARILRSAPAEAMRAQSPPAPARAGALRTVPARFAAPAAHEHRAGSARQRA